MLPRSQRLSVEQFNSVIEKGKIFHSPLFLVRVLNVDKSTRIATVAPKKIAKKAVERNKLRRRMYEAVAPLVDKIVGNFYIIIFAKNTAVLADNKMVANDIKSIFVKSSLLK